MYLRTTTRRNKDGTEVRYLQLAHNEWDAAAGQSVVRVVHSFGREDQLDRDGDRAAGRVAVAAAGPGRGAGGDRRPGSWRSSSPAPMGGAWVLDGLWRRLGIDTTLAQAAGGPPARPRR